MVDLKELLHKIEWPGECFGHRTIFFFIRRMVDGQLYVTTPKVICCFVASFAKSNDVQVSISVKLAKNCMRQIEAYRLPSCSWVISNF
jgi:hypothetical protein